MKVNLLAFGIVKEIFQRSVIEIDLDGTPTISNLKSELEKNYPRPDVVIVVDGADPYEHDELASTDKLKLTHEQLLTRDMMVYEFFKSRKIPQSYVMAGGYGKRAWEIYSQFLKQIIKA